jgi:hypothetical protein
MTVSQAAKFDIVRLQTQYNTCTMNPASFLVTNQRRIQNILLAVSRQSLTNYSLTVKQRLPCGLSQCDTLHSDTNVAEKHATSVFNVKVCLSNVRAAKSFTTYGTGMTSSCRTQTQFHDNQNHVHDLETIFNINKPYGKKQN